MSYRILDFYFPFIVFFYGALITFLLSSEFFCKLAEERLPIYMTQQLKSHRILALVSLWVGGLWSLQNIWAM
ncbi:MAG: hypothetical protein KDD50_08110 [Bdellovibrionales bacterium]|nr:hypothetical protein [Bdellovibrionales bacterium]